MTLTLTLTLTLALTPTPTPTLTLTRHKVIVFFATARMLQLHAKMLGGGTAPAGGGTEQGHGQGGEGTADLRVLEIHSRLSQAARTHGGMQKGPSWCCHSCCPGRPGRTHAASGLGCSTRCGGVPRPPRPPMVA